MKLDPIVSVASTLEATPGSVALLLGSGISRAAGIPTGWEVVSDLCRRYAILQTGKEPDDAVAWFRSTSDEDPDYSNLLEALASAPGDRRDLLSSYFLPSEGDAESGAKLPTRAHRAIAALVVSGAIRVIVTTNFDKLLETALREAGVEPNIVTPNTASTALSIARARCTVVKVHGDYLEPDIRNTVAELSTYSADLDRLLDRIFDDHALLISGWSGEWDHALREAILRSPPHRYATWWTTVGDISEKAQTIVDHRDAKVIKVAGADALFEELAEKVASLAQLAERQQVLGRALAVETLKRYIPDPLKRIRLRDLVLDEASRVREHIGRYDRSEQPNQASVEERMHDVESCVEPLAAMLAALVYYDDRFDHTALIAESIMKASHVSEVHNGTSYDVWTALERYPVTLMLYAVSLAALQRGHVSPLAAVYARADAPDPYDRSKRETYVSAGPAWALNHDVCNEIRTKGSGTKLKTPRSDYLFDAVRPFVAAMFTSEDEYASAFDDVEYLLALCSAAGIGHPAIGRFGWRLGHWGDGLGQVLDRLQRNGALAALQAAGVLPPDVDGLNHAVELVQQGAKRLPY
jgi:hypothetical protein